MGNVFLEMENISKSFGGVQALTGVRLAVAKGEIHAIVGENGAGKSTLMKVLGGVYQPDTGTMRIEGREVVFPRPTASLDAGIAVIHQDFNIFPHLNVVENIWLGRYSRKGAVSINWGEMKEKTQKLLTRLAADFSPTDRVGDLSAANKQMVAIARGLSFEPKILIMDEPTSSLTPKEVVTLFKIMRSLSASGVSLIFISHHLPEVIEMADKITVLRDGGWVATYSRGEVDSKAIAQAMVGRKVETLYPAKDSRPGDVFFKAENVACTKNKVNGVSFALKRGEVLGVSGLVGSGRSELMLALFGVGRRKTGTLFKDGREIEINSAQDAINHGIMLVPEDRQEQGLNMNMSVKLNVTMAILNRIMTKFRRIIPAKETGLAKDMIAKLSIKTTGPEQRVSNLSGGNQQKVVLGKALATEPEILILDEPTRGIDVGARLEIHKLIRNLAAAGKSIILVSSDLPEIVGISDRVLVMSRGKVVAELADEEITAENIMYAATGGDQVGSTRTNDV
ncbi:MAG TPA: sugar ABC transporter ATP-binding protein [Firmicutes bacterium]|nr:sugar ABC transporter ATP-binding protein [Bacillota bacterium]